MKKNTLNLIKFILAPSNTLCFMLLVFGTVGFFSYIKSNVKNNNFSIEKYNKQLKELTKKKQIDEYKYLDISNIQPAAPTIKEINTVFSSLLLPQEYTFEWKKYPNSLQEIFDLKNSQNISDIKIMSLESNFISNYLTMLKILYKIKALNIPILNRYLSFTMYEYPIGKIKMNLLIPTKEE